MKSTDPPIIVEQLFDKSIAEVWAAITRHDVLIQWFFQEIPDFKAEVGFKTRFNIKAPSRDFMHLWEVTEVIPNRRIVTNWKYEGYKGDSFVTFELGEIGTQTQLKLSTKVVDDFDDSIPEFKYESGVAGWNYFIKEQLYSYLKD